jgi:hypothetical protein
MDPNLPDFVLQNLNTRKQGGFPMDREEYQVLVEAARPHAERLATILGQAGLADEEKWIQRWESEWSRVIEESCDDDGKCLVNSN